MGWFKLPHGRSLHDSIPRYALDMAHGQCASGIPFTSRKPLRVRDSIVASTSSGVGSGRLTGIEFCSCTVVDVGDSVSSFAAVHKTAAVTLPRMGRSNSITAYTSQGTVADK